jgi:lysozyme
MSSTVIAASTPITPGIDVSHHQGQVNWYLVAEGGISFAFAKATEGVTFVDPRFSANWIGIKDAGMIRGAYHFFRPAKPVDAQVDNFARTVGEIKDGDLPPVLDLEEAPTPNGDEWDDIPGDQRVPLVLSWLEGVEAKLGRKPIIYTRRSFVAAELPNAAPLGQYLLWVAHYTAKPAPALPSPWSKWTFWQYSAAGTVDGIEGPADLDRFNGSLSDLEQLAGVAASTSI